MRLSIILPTYNERENVILAVERIDKALESAKIEYEIVVVDDDSPDSTWEQVEDLSRTRHNIHLIRRIGRKGLSSAVVEGFAAARGELLGVMDADLQHDASILPAMLDCAGEPNVDLVVATRYSRGGSTGDWIIWRWLLSKTATAMSWLVIRTRVSDPMSGYFFISSRSWRNVARRLNPRGFKILLEIITRSKPLKFREVGYTFQPRQFGESKLDTSVGVAYLRALYDLSCGRVVPLRLLLYCVVGVSGVAVNLCILWIVNRRLQVDGVRALVFAISASMLSNFLLNNFITFGNRRRYGWQAILSGLALFVIICSVGAVMNFAIARFAFGRLGFNIYVADIVGIAVSTAWNFSLNREYTWKKRFAN
jgi:dolichol-phosphate mannosyltransferase